MLFRFGYRYVPHACLTIIKVAGARVKFFSGEGDSKLILFSVIPEPRIPCGKSMSQPKLNSVYNRRL